MKKIILIPLLLLGAYYSPAQDIAENQLPSLVRNSFQKTFPKASDVDWEMDGSHFKVEFETGLFGTDHHAWFDQSGKLLRHKEAIAKSELPAAVRSKLSKEFSAYRTDDIDKITEGSAITYNIELKSFSGKWKAVFDSTGRVLDKRAD